MSYPNLTPTSTTSAIVLPITGSSSSVNDALPYKIYSDTASPLYSSDFLLGATEQVAYVYKKLGGDVLDIELTAGNVYSAYEETCLEYSYIVNVHQATNLLSNALGSSTGSFDHKGHIKETTPGNTPLATVSGSHVALKYPKFDYGFTRRIAEGMSDEAGLGSSTQYSASFNTVLGQQDYDLQAIIEEQAYTTGRRSVKATATVTIDPIYTPDSGGGLQLNDNFSIITTDGTEVLVWPSNENLITTHTDGTTPRINFRLIDDDSNATAGHMATMINQYSKLEATANANVVTITQSVAGDDGNTMIDGLQGLEAVIQWTDFKNGNDEIATSTAPYAGKINGKKILVKKVYYKTPHAMWRFYGYYGGLNVVGNLHNYGQFSDDSSFQLIPTWQNKAQALAFEDAIYTRMSHFSYELHDNKLRLFPKPYGGSPSSMWIEFSIAGDVWDDDSNGDSGNDGVNNMNTLPLANLPYESINSIGKQWIRRFSLSLCKEMLGQVRSKFATVPIPGESITLNGADLISQGREEQDKLREELKTTLAEMTYSKLAETTNVMLDSANKAMVQVPMHIFVE